MTFTPCHEDVALVVFRCWSVVCISTQRRVDSSLSLPEAEGIHLFVNIWNSLGDVRNQWLCCLEHTVLSACPLLTKLLSFTYFFCAFEWSYFLTGLLSCPTLSWVDSHSHRHQQIHIYRLGRRNKVIPSVSQSIMFFLSSKCIMHVSCQE